MFCCPEVEGNPRLSQGSLSRLLFGYQGPFFSEGQCRADGAGAVMSGLAACGLGRAVHLVASVSVRRGFLLLPLPYTQQICCASQDKTRE